MRFSFAKEIGPKEIVREKRGTGRDKIDEKLDSYIQYT